MTEENCDDLYFHYKLIFMRRGIVLIIRGIYLIIFSCSVLMAYPAAAWTQCQDGVSRVWAGDDSNIWVHLNNGGTFVVPSANPSKEAILSMAITALTASREIIIRYEADGVSCDAVGRNDVLGMYLL